MRWEWDQPLYEVNNKQTNINLTTGAILFAGQDGNSRALYNSFYGGVMPRIGFAYTPQSLAGKFVVRGGYGITNFLEGTGANLRLPLNPPFFTDASGTHTEGDAYFQIQNGFPRPADATTFAGNVRAWDPNLKPALIQQYNLTTETELNTTLPWSSRTSARAVTISSIRAKPTSAYARPARFRYLRFRALVRLRRSA